MVISRLFDRLLPPDRSLDPRALAWVAVILAAIAMLAIESSIAVGVYGAPVALAFALSLVHVGCLPLAMLRPLFATITSALVCGVLPLLAPTAVGLPWPWTVPMMITQVLVILIVGLRAHWGVALGALLGSIAASSAAAAVGHFLLEIRRSESTVVTIVVFSCIAGGVYVAAVIVRQWNLIRSQLVREKENTAVEHSKRVAVEEKTRIARELHDIVAHSMSIINIQASSAPFRHAGIDAEVAEEFETISVSARHALTEMRGLLSVLRNDDSGHELAPQPRFSEIGDLISQAQQAGIHVRLRQHGDDVGSGLRESTGLAGYRIVQEALSNAVRHIRDPEIDVDVYGDGHTMTISVVNTRGNGPAEPVGHSSDQGQGLIGMRERAASVGGQLRSGWTPGNTYEVVATLPLDPETDDGEERS
ncbi:sensor histidine kinase [Brevibacterium atlanticum]|uniref:sensor histidine kinase n=1 Tax=Brevibacterium atlanticum TaxID=2697563 RepID=UPI0014235283|nr:histidine kinase [Brevibacterium atlanticum]